MTTPSASAGRPLANSLEWVLHSDQPAVLARIHEPHAHIAIWERALPEAVTAWLKDLPPDSLPQGRDVVSVPEAPALFRRLWRDAGQIGPQARQLADDMSALCQRFAAVVQTSALHIRLEAISGDACKRFHMDHVHARLITTYRGPGSEWGIAAEGHVPPVIHRLAPGMVALFKGRLYPGLGPPQVLHRSPPLAGSGITRLVLCLDSAEGPFASAGH